MPRPWASPLEIPSGQKWGAGLPGSLHLPASLCVGLRITPDQLVHLCQAHSERALSWARSGSGRSTIVRTTTEAGVYRVRVEDDRIVEVEPLSQGRAAAASRPVE
jgi:hypothetical protein